jgi:hypothetical protein
VRSFYFILGTAINLKKNYYVYELSSFLADLGSTFFYFGLFFFIIHWSETMIGSGGMSQELVEKRLKLSKIMLYFSIFLIGIVQLMISFARMLIFILVPISSFDFGEILQVYFKF